MSQPTIDVSEVYLGGGLYSGTRVGSGLQNIYRATLGGANHGGVTVRIQSSDASVALVAPDGTTPGSAAIDVTIPDGQTTYDFYVQGASGATGTALISASQALFAPGATLPIQVVPPVFYLGGLPGTTTTLSADSPFYASTGIRNDDGTAWERAQVVSAAAPPLVVTFSSSNTAVSEVKTTAAHGASVTVSMPAGTYYTPTSVAEGGATFDPVGGGTTTVTASAPGFATFSTASQAVTVTQPTIDVTDAYGIGTRVGSGLQTIYRVTLGGSEHGGVTVRIASNAPDVARVAQDATTPGTSFIDVFIPNGQTYYDFYVQGVSGTTGTAVISASQALFAAGSTLIIQVVPPVFYLEGLPGSTTSSSADDSVLCLHGDSERRRHSLGAGAIRQCGGAAGGDLH